MLSNKVHFPKTRIYEISGAEIRHKERRVKMGLHLLEKDLKEGKELMEICENLSEEDRLLAQIYILALTDRSKYHGSVKK